MSCNRAHFGDIGTTFRATIKDGLNIIDVSSATLAGEKELLFKPPVGATKTFEAAWTTDGTDGQIEYITAAGTDLDEAGTWQWQAHVVLDSGDWHSEIRTFEVDANL